jgi:hypothetical protein
MGYYEGEKSVGLAPIVLALSVVAMIGFGLLYFMVGRQTQASSPAEMSAPAQPSSAAPARRV